MNAKPRALTWLEQETGEPIPYTPAGHPSNGRHLSVRLPAGDAELLERMAAERGVKLSQLVRSILAAALAERAELATLPAADLAARLAADVAEVQRRLAS